jgi:hypothetical protein
MNSSNLKEPIEAMGIILDLKLVGAYLYQIASG